MSLCICVAIDKNRLLNETCTQITFSITDGEGRVWCRLVSFHVLCHNFHVNNLIGYGHMPLRESRCVKPLNWKTVLAKLVTNTSTYISLS